MCAAVLIQVIISLVSLRSLHHVVYKNYSLRWNFLCVRWRRGEAVREGDGPEVHSSGVKVSREVFNLCYETTLIFSERAVHKMFIFKGWGGGEWVIFWGVVTNVTWVWHEFRKKDAPTSQAIDAGAAMATGPWIKAMWLIMGWLTHNARPVLLHKLPLNECVLIKRTYLHSATVQGAAMTAAQRLHLGAHGFLPARARAHMLYINTHFSAQ